MTQDEIIEMARQAGINYRELSDEFATGNGDGVEIEQMQAFVKLVAVKKRNDTLEEVAKEFDKMKVFGDTAASFAIFVREMKND